ncbi:MAG TPA: C1 family peptidase [Terriglobales bacterium]|nr:C1 family peptidase [Terriglobales bacterium]
MAAVMPLPVLEKDIFQVPVPKPIPPYGYVELQAGQIVGTGWLQEFPDTRDFTDQHPQVAEIVDKLNITRARKATRLTLPTEVDLRPWCSPIEDQGLLGSCTANAAAGIVEYYERRAFNRFIDASRLFIYKTTRDLLGWTGDTGAYIRTTMAALTMFGVPPENYWPYTDRHQPGTGNERTFDLEPTAFTYEVAEKFEAMNYICHDPFGTPVPPATLLNNIKLFLGAGIPVMFGFYVFPSYTQTDVLGAFPYPTPGERAFAGHAVVAVGYDDNMKIKNLVSNKTTTGALLIRNSWGTKWGNGGYGWLPTNYVLSQYASDFWSLLGMKWIETKQFGLPI